VLPKFAAIFADMGIALPTATRLMLEAGNFLHAWWWLLLGGTLLFIVAFRRFYRHPEGRRLVDRLILKCPGLGPMLVKIDLARFFRTLGAMLAGGLPILEALEIVGGVISNSLLREKIEHLREELRRGAVISRVLAADALFPSLAVHMIGVGEETGNLDEMLDKLAEMYDRELKVTIKALTSLFEPLVILFMGLVIGAIVISMLMAIFSVNELGG
jgi:general secretion pathway protein F